MTIATQISTTHNGRKRSPSRLRNPTVRDILRQQQDEEDLYLMFARPHVNRLRVSAAMGAAIAAQRQAVDLTQEAAARRAFIDIKRLAALESGREPPDICELLAISEAIGIDPRDLFKQALEVMGYPVGYRPVRTPQPRSIPSS